jgi:hypothetical protein
MRCHELSAEARVLPRATRNRLCDGRKTCRTILKGKTFAKRVRADSAPRHYALMQCIATTAAHVPVAARPGVSLRRGGAPCAALPKRAASVDASAARASSSETVVVLTASEEVSALGALSERVSGPDSPSSLASPSAR